jgi:hypothetical protein
VTVEIIDTHPLTEEILDAHRDHARGDERGDSGSRSSRAS